MKQEKDTLDLKQSYKKENKLERSKKSKGITLIALVVTIIVLLILAGISISMLTANNGIMSKTATSKEETRGATVKEYVDLWKLDKTVANYAKNINAHSKKDLLDDLESKELLINNERERLENGETITIGSKQIDLGNYELTDLDKLKIYFVEKQGPWDMDNNCPANEDPINDASTSITLSRTRHNKL